MQKSGQPSGWPLYFRRYLYVKAVRRRHTDRQLWNGSDLANDLELAHAAALTRTGRSQQSTRHFERRAELRRGREGQILINADFLADNVHHVVDVCIGHGDVEHNERAVQAVGLLVSLAAE